MFVKIMLFASLCVIGESQDLICSPFEYEEKTYEKMIKTETYVDKIKNDTDAVHQDLLTGLSGLREELESTKTELMAEKERHTSFLNEIRAQPYGIETVAFYVHNLDLSKEYDHDETLMFTTTKFDIGSGYSSSSGRYVVPVSGIYYLSLQLCLNETTGVSFEIFSNNTIIQRGSPFDENNAYTGCFSMSVVAMLGEKEHVGVKVGYAVSTSAIFMSNESVSNSFSGVFVAAYSDN